MPEQSIAVAPEAKGLQPRGFVAASPVGRSTRQSGSGPSGSPDSGPVGGSSQIPITNGDPTLSAPDTRSGATASAGTSLLIIDDCALYREALATNLRMNGIGDVLVAWDLPSLIGVLEEAEPSVILLNIDTRNLHLILRAATSLTPSTPVIAVAASEDNEDEVIACAEAGVAGYHLRSESFADLLVLISEVASGKVSCPQQFSAMLIRRLSVIASHRPTTPKDPVLTARESQILEMLELGRSNHDIAVQLSIAVHTVKNHVHSLLTKLGVGTRAEAAALSHALRVDRDTHVRARSRSSQSWL